MIKLVVGLGNPGPEYEATRHNAGFWWWKRSRASSGATGARTQLLGPAARRGPGQPVWLLEPQTFMNLSGKSAAALSRFFKIAPEEILVVRRRICNPRAKPSAAAGMRDKRAARHPHNWAAATTGAFASVLATRVTGRTWPAGAQTPAAGTAP